MDWITLLIEAVGIAIAILWTIVPAREFVEIFRRLRRESRPKLAEPPGGFPAVQRDRGDREDREDREGRPS